MDLPAPPTLEEARAQARRHGLASLGGRPPLREYLADLWQRRSFIATLSAGQSEARYQNNQLGRLWSVLNPLLLIVSYFLVFGLLLGTRRGIDNFIGFLATGVVLYGMTATVIQSGSKSITSNTGLVRALRFPRAVLPLSVALTETFATLPAFGVLVLTMVLTGEPLQWKWLLFPVALVIQIVGITGFALAGARLVHVSRDLANLIPVVLRVTRYMSGVFFSITVFAAKAPEPIRLVLEYQPFALQMTTARQSLMVEQPIIWSMWIAAAVWSVVAFVVGLVVFWRGEGTYGRG